MQDNRKEAKSIIGTLAWAAGMVIESMFWTGLVATVFFLVGGMEVVAR